MVMWNDDNEKEYEAFSKLNIGIAVLMGIFLGLVLLGVIPLS